MNKEFIPKFKNSCCGFLKSLAGNPLPAIIFLFLVVFALGSLIFYRYDVLVKNSQPETLSPALQFEKELYQKTLKEWQARDERFAAADSRNYINPFQEKREKPVLTVVEEPKAVLVDPRLLSARNLLEFYALKGESMPLLDSRAKMWQEFGLGSIRSYIGSTAQNQLLLEEMKKQLTE